jgi:lipid-binding SYLF domain-containing protein
MEYFKKQESLKPYFQGAYGFGLFEKVGKAGFGIGGAYGEGKVYLNKDGKEELVGNSTMMQVSFGFQFGGQLYSELIFFETERDYLHFISDNFEFGADANVVALTASASAKVSTMGNQGITAGMTPAEMKITKESAVYTKGMAIFTITQGGLMYEATVKGQKFTYRPITAPTSS